MVTLKRPAFLCLLLSALTQCLSAQTTVALTTTPNPSIFGAAVTLTAAVTPATSTGVVTFYDGVTVLGTKSLTSGAASLSTITLPAGSRKLRAYYTGTTSNVVTQVVNAQASASLAARSLGIASTGAVLATGDFNGDGKADLLTFNAILLGDGAGNFQSKTSPFSSGFGSAPPTSVAIADFDGDGNADIAFPNGSSAFVALGKGDGTFQTPAAYPVTDATQALAAGDFNGDGKADIVTANPASGVHVLLGKGDGTFQPSVTYSTSIQTGPGVPQASVVVTGDFNGDGKTDLATSSGGTITILTGNGDGTFQLPTVVTLPRSSFTLVAADLNGDGRTDLVTDNDTVLLAKSDGTFQPPVSYASIAGPVVLGDFNGDGNIDLLATGLPATILYGKGDGTFQPPVDLAVAVDRAVAGEFNGDGKTDLAISAGSTATLLLGTTVTVTPVTGTPQSTVKGTAFPTPLQVVVKDGANTVSGVVVTFQAPALATLSSTTATTDANGLASVTATATSLVGGPYIVTATALGVTAEFSLRNLFAAPSVIIPSPSAPQSTPLGTAFASPLQVTLQDVNGGPASGVPVTFAAPSSGASATLSATTVLTDATGTAKVTATANNTRGSYTVTATAGSLSANFSLTNLQAATVTLTTSGNPTTFGAPLTLVAIVSSATSSGRVTFYDGVSLLGTKPVSSGAAAISTITLPAGDHKLTAIYRDDANSVGGTSNTVTETVKTTAAAALAAQPAISLPATPSAVVVGDFNGDGKADFAYAATANVPSWWQVDLGTSTIRSIVIWNRTDCCGDRLRDYWVFASDTPFQPTDTPATLQNRAGTFSSHQTTAPSPSASITLNGQGRYVRVQLTNPGYLSLAEVQVFGIGSQINLALGRPATQSSTYFGFAGTAASSAVDGNTNGDYNVGSVSTTDIASAAVTVVLGKGDGTFQAPTSYGVDGSMGIFAAAAGDFNGDGISDLAVGSTVGFTGNPYANVNILLGNGDGTFRPSVSRLAGGLPSGGGPIVTGDFNGDSKADVLMVGVTLGCRFCATLLAGNGDGSFAAPVIYGAIAANDPLSTALADFNGDGNPDVVINTGVFLGYGDGTHQPLITLPVLGTTNVTAGDFNGDGKTDLAIGGRSGPLPGVANTSILLGNGDGTFQAPITSSLGAAALSGDFNGDGILDLVVTDSSGNTSGILLGNGDGTFHQGFALPSGAPFAVADFNGDGRADILTGNPNGVVILAGAVSASISVTATGGTPQSTSVGSPFVTPLQVTVLNNGVPVPGAAVTFSAPTSGASATLSSTTATTNAAGVASVNATANSVSGTYTVTAAYNGVTASFSLTNTVFAFLTATGGTPQSTVVGTAFANPLQATVKDALGNPVGGVTVTFAAPTVGASATLSSSTAVTNAAGVASITATANGISGSYTVTASVGSLTASFALTNTAVQVASVTATDGTPQSTAVGTAFAKALQVTVKGPGANDGPMAGVTVTFSAPTVGASAALSSSTAVTNASGIASVTATANNVAGSYTITASVGSVSAQFSLTNTAAAAGSITSTGGTPQSAQAGTAFATPLQATVKDAGGNPVSGATVTFAAPTVGASAVLSSATAVTNASGVASVTATANNVTGSYAVTASIGGLSTLFSLTNVTSGPVNLALRKIAIQSSTLPGFPTAAASSAVDGNTNGAFYSGSVTATDLGTTPWWQVDLGATSTVNSVVISNRTDCCASRLGDYWVFVSNTPFLAGDTPATLQNRAGTFASHQTIAPDPSTTIDVGGLQARYVRVQLTGTDYLSLAEVQVIGTGGVPPSVNLAANKLASQSSTLAGYPTSGASSAVDGNTDGGFFGGSVTATNPDTNAWWQVDLGATASVGSVVVWNRTDCCGSRLNDYWVFISDTPFLPTDTPATLQNRAGTFSSHQTTAPDPSTIINANAPGRYVRIQLNGTNYLSLAEVQVFGTGGAPAPTLVSLGKPATQSSTLAGYPSAVATSAVDGNTDGGFFGGSVTATNPDANPWWQVDLGASTQVSSVVIWNRTDCCSARLNDYWVFVSDTPFLASDTPATLQNRAGTFASHQTTTPSPSVTIPVGAPGRYVRVQLNGTNYLSLAEVQVYGQ